MPYAVLVGDDFKKVIMTFNLIFSSGIWLVCWLDLKSNMA